MTKNHIGALPASALIFCCRIFYLLTYSPRGPEYGGSASMTAFLAAGLVSIGLCAVFWGLLRWCGALRPARTVPPAGQGVCRLL